MSSYEVVERGAAAGIVITASHNPWVDNGFKVKAPTGAAAGAGHPRGRSRRASPRTAARPIERRPFADAEAAGLVERFDPFEGYERFVRRTVDLDALQGGRRAASSSTRCGAPGAGWISPAAGRRADPGHRDPPGAQPVLRRRQPGADPPEHRRGARRCSPAAATTWACSSTATPTGPARPTSAGTFIHQLQVTGPADVLPGRAPRLARPGRRQRQQHLDGRRGSASATGSRRYETPVGFKFIGPKMIETGAMMGAEESGGFGFGMHLPERDGIYADLLLLDLFLRETRRRPLAGLERHRALPRDRRTVVLPADRRPRRARPLRRRRSAGCWSTCAAQAAGRAGRPAGDPDHAARHRTTASSSSLADGSWLLIRASGTEPLVRVYTEATSAATARRAARGRRAAGARLMSGARPAPAGASTSRGATSSSGRTPTATSARSSSSRPGERLSLQRHEVKDESILVLSGRLRLYLEDDDGRGPASRSSGPGESPARPTGRIHRYEAIERCELDRGLDARARRRRPARGRLRPRRDERPVSSSEVGCAT